MKDHPHIVVLTDFSQAARQAYPVAHDLAARTGGRIELLNVVRELPALPHAAPLAPPVPETQGTLESRVETAKEGLVKERAHFPGPEQVATKALVSREIAEGVVQYTSEEDADLVVMATHGRSGIRRVLMGSIAESVLRSTRVPVLIAPART